MWMQLQQQICGSRWVPCDSQRPASSWIAGEFGLATSEGGRLHFPGKMNRAHLQHQLVGGDDALELVLPQAAVARREFEVPEHLRAVTSDLTLSPDDHSDQFIQIDEGTQSPADTQSDA